MQTNTVLSFADTASSRPQSLRQPRHDFDKTPAHHELDGSICLVHLPLYPMQDVLEQLIGAVEYLL